MATTNNQDQRIPQLLRLGVGEVATDDLIPIVDMSAASNGVTKATTVEAIADLIEVPAPISVTGGSWQIFTDVAFGGVAGGADNAAAFAAVTAAGSKDTFMPDGVFDVDSNVTIDFNMVRSSGFQIRPANGVVVTVTGHPGDTPSYWMNTSQGGEFDFTGNTTIKRYDARWANVVGDGALGLASSTDDQPALLALANAVPSGSVIELAAQMVVRVDSTLTLQSLEQISIEGPVDPTPDGNADGVVKIVWGGTINTGPMVFRRSTNSVHFKNIHFVTDYFWDGSTGTYANQALATDLSGENGVTGQLNGCENVVFSTNRTSADVDDVIQHYLGENASGNQEFNWYKNVWHRGPAVEVKQSTGTVSTTTLPNDTITFADHIASAGLATAGCVVELADGDGAGLRYEGVVLTRVSDTVITVDPPCGAAVSNKQAILGRVYATGYKQGASSDIHRTRFEDVHVISLRKGIDHINGSIEVIAGAGQGCETDIDVTDASLPVRIVRWNGEQSRQFLSYAAGAPLELHGNRVSPLFCRPNQNMAEITGGGSVHHHLNYYNEAPPAGSTVFGLTSHSGIWDEGVNFWAPGTTAAQKGVLGNTGPVHGVSRVLGDAGFEVVNQDAYFYMEAANSLYRAVQAIIYANGGFSGEMSALTGVGRFGPSANSGDMVVGVTGTGDIDATGNISLKTIRCGQGKMPQITPGGQVATAFEGWTVTSPVVTGAGGATDAYGFTCEPLTVAGITNPGWAFRNKGASDKNWFAGKTYFGPVTNVPITNLQIYTPSLTPSSVAAATVAEQTFTVSGLTTADKVIVNPPSIANATGIAGARVSAADTLAIRFVNPTAGALTPSSGTYTVLAIRS